MLILFTDFSSLLLSFFKIGSNNSSGADKWIEVSYTQWAEKKKDKLTQLEGMLKKYEAESPDIGAWIKRRVVEAELSTFGKEL